MKDPYELTIIISNYNQDKHIAETIDSALSQRVNFPFKIIITDDYSCNDRSKEIIRDYVSRYGNIEPIFGEENKGYLANILRAKAKTRTKYFCLLDADDYWTDKDFLQRAYEFLNTHEKYSIYEANVEVAQEDGKGRFPYISQRYKQGTYSKEMYLKNKPIPITQTTGMFFRNSIFINGIPQFMEDAVGTRSERSFEGDTGRFIMHLKYGLAYYDNSISGVYRITKNGIWTSLSEAKKQIITARFYPDFYQFYGSDVGFFVTKAYKSLQAYLAEKQKELTVLIRQDEFIDEYEKLMFNDVYDFCMRYANEINVEKNNSIEKVKRIIKIMRA